MGKNRFKVGNIVKVKGRDGRFREGLRSAIVQVDDTGIPYLTAYGWMKESEVAPIYKYKVGEKVFVRRGFNSGEVVTIKGIDYADDLIPYEDTDFNWYKEDKLTKFDPAIHAVKPKTVKRKAKIGERIIITHLIDESDDDIQIGDVFEVESYAKILGFEEGDVRVKGVSIYVGYSEYEVIVEEESLVSFSSRGITYRRPGVEDGKCTECGQEVDEEVDLNKKVEMTFTIRELAIMHSVNGRETSTSTNNKVSGDDYVKDLFKNEFVESTASYKKIFNKLKEEGVIK